MIYHRLTPEGTFLKKEDYIHGFGMDTSFYNQIHAAREKYNQSHPDSPLPLRDDFKEDWDTRTGLTISGAPFNTRHHPLQNLKLRERESGKNYIVDSVHKQHYYGFYIVLLIRAEGTQSHGVAYWENISCKDTTILEGIQEAHERFEIIK